MLFETIAKIIAERTDCDVADVKLDSRFEDMGIDSLDTMEVLIQLEGEIGKEIELEQKVDTVEDLIKVIESQME